jgi:hypothetical protein
LGIGLAPLGLVRAGFFCCGTIHTKFTPLNRKKVHKKVHDPAGFWPAIGGLILIAAGAAVFSFVIWACCSRASVIVDDTAA